jgi:Domain of Unknown Function (DUF1206)
LSTHLTVKSGTSAIHTAADSRPMNWAARAGLTARGLVYLIIGILAWSVSRGGHHEVDQRGALEQVLAHPYGKLLLGAMAVGFAAYALWRLSEALFGVVCEGHGAGPRVKSLFRGLVYGSFAVSSVSLLMGSYSSQSGQQTEITARVMHHSGGRLLVGAVGVVIAVVGLGLAWEGLRLRFMKYFPTSALSRGVLSVIRLFGRIGNVARGLVFTLTGVLVVVAAVRFEPSKAGGLDEALKTLRDRSYGPLILGVMAVGLMIFGLYGLLEARYRRV